MGLPVINEFPEHTITLPCSKKVLKYRPFTAKEQVNLLVAKESVKNADESSGVDVDGIFSTIRNTLANCVLNDVDIDELPLPDFEYFMLKIRAESVSEVAETRFRCEIKNSDGEVCGGLTDVNVNLNDIKLTGEVPDPKIQISDNVVVELRGPAFKLTEILKDGDNLDKNLLRIIADLIVTIWVGEDVYNARDYSTEDKIKFLENFTTQQFNKLAEFIINYPSLKIDIEYACKKCGYNHKFEVRNVSDFFG